jgi:TfoX/Sxy family transcriptional regulator of competence genes
VAYDEALAARVRRALAAQPEVVEKPMFGGLTFMVGGNMSCGVNRDELMIRLDAGTAVEDLRSPHVRDCDFTTRPMRGMFTVNAAGCATQQAVDQWVRLALGHALSLSPKKMRPAQKA